MKIDMATFADLDLKRPTDDWFLIVSVEGCQACDNLKEAIGSINLEDFPQSALVITVDDLKASYNALDELGISEFPTLIHYIDANEVTRWGGFFDDEDAATRLEKMTELLRPYFSKTSASIRKT